MKKNYFLLLLAVVVVTIVSCQGKKVKELQNPVKSGTDTVIVQELKNELIRIFEEYQKSEFNAYKSTEQGGIEKKKVTNEVSTPLHLAEKAQTLDQKYFLLGMYLQDVLAEKYKRNKNDPERNKVVAKLSIEVNLPALGHLNWEEAEKKTWDELHNEKAESQLADFKIALGNCTADRFIRMATGAYVQTKYAQTANRDAIGDYASTKPEVWETQWNVENCLIDLADKLWPYYPSLKSIQPLISDLKNLHQAQSGEEINAAYGKMIKNIRECRAEFIAELQ